MDEYIERKVLINQFCERCNEEMSESPCEPSECFAMDIFKAIPAADVEPVKHGRWLPQILLGTRVWDCSECKTIGSPVWKRCPVCEAKMDLEVDHAEK